MLGADNPLVLVPSTYVWPHVRVNCDDPWPRSLIYRAPHLVEEIHGPSAPDLERALRALAAPTRLAILRLVAERPRSTQEIASLGSLSEAAASKHLRLFASAGLLSARREGCYVLYSLERERLAEVAREVRGLG